MSEAQRHSLSGPDFSLRGKRALITGSTQGLGLAIAQAYAAAGAELIIHGRDAKRANAVAETLAQSGVQASVWIQDLAFADQLAQSFDACCTMHGVPDILVNNVGQRLRKPFAQARLSEIMQLIHVDLVAGVELSRLAAGALCETRGWGRIITLTSIAGELARYGDAIYPVAKQGLAGMVRALAVEYGRHGITSNGIAPGTFATESNAALAADPLKGPQVVGRNPLARWARPDEITGAAVFLASPSASYVNGHILVVDGGFSITF